MKKKSIRKRPKMVSHVWFVRVRHRDYEASERGIVKQLFVMETTLVINVKQQVTNMCPNIDMALARTRAFIRRHQRDFAIATVLGFENHGTVDE